MKALHLVTPFLLAVTVGCSPPPQTCIEIAVICPDDQAPIDSDGDGCPLECPAEGEGEGEEGEGEEGEGDGDFGCEPLICDDDEAPIDSNGDGCEDECVGTPCPPMAECPAGEQPVDADDDGCFDGCTTPCPEILVTCGGGVEPIDSDGDGCFLECPAAGVCNTDTDCGVDEVCAAGVCEFVDCPAVVLECPAGFEARALPHQCESCQPIVVCPPIEVECLDGADPVDNDRDGCFLECPGVCLSSDDCANDEVCTFAGCDGIVCPDVVLECPFGFEARALPHECETCQPIVVCPPIFVECLDGADPVDSDGDGCFLECPDVCRSNDECANDQVCTVVGCDGIACPDVVLECPAGFEPRALPHECDSCQPIVVCPPTEVQCPGGDEPIDRDGDGCFLECP
jgi:hypothetical protein